jgi:proton-translocating NADH-quinone oxidoreductase chain M
MLPGTELYFPYLPIGPMLLALLLPPIAAVFILLTLATGKKLGLKGAGILSSVTLAISTLLLFWVLFQVMEKGTAVYEQYSWFSTGDIVIEFSLLSDFLNLPLTLAIISLATVSSIYSIEYIKEKHDFELYYFNLLLFATGMLGVTLATNLIQFYLFFEGMNIPAFFLVSGWGTKKAKTIALKYILYVVAGALCLLAGIVWTYSLTNSFGIYEIPVELSGIQYQNVTLFRTIALFISTGFGIKMGVFPVHSWLPDFHGEAPVPIHALLSAVMIKTGAYGLVRITYFFFPQVISDSSFLLAIIGLISMFWGAGMALVQVDFKRVLAYSSVNQVGYILLGLSTGTTAGIAGGLFHMITHGLAKGILLYSAGSLVHSAGTKYIPKLGGVSRKMPLTATVALIGALAIAGTPPLATFPSEFLIFAGTFQAGYTLIAILGVMSTALTAGYYLWTIRRMFFGPDSKELDIMYDRYIKGIEIPDEGIPRRFEDVKESPAIMILPMLLIASLVVIFGIFPWIVLQIIYPISETLSNLIGGV